MFGVYINPGIGIIWGGHPTRIRKCGTRLVERLDAPGPSSVLLLSPPAMAIVLAIVMVIVIVVVIVIIIVIVIVIVKVTVTVM